MFEPRKLRVHYSVENSDGSHVDFDIRLDEQGLLEGLADSGPEWTRLQGERCSGCTAQHAYCRAALAIAPVVEAFKSMDSLQSVKVRVSLPNQTVDARGEISQVASSIMGLRMAASGCPQLAPFRAMALYHQPFSTLEDTVIRAAGFMLLGHWAHGTLTSENPFDPLIAAWEELEEVNTRICRGMQAYCAADAALNGLVNLDMFAKAGGFGLQAALDALKPALLAWDIGLPAAAPATTLIANA